MTDENGVPYDEKTVSATGECHLDLGEIASPVLTFNKSEIKPEGRLGQDKSYGGAELMFYVILTVVVTFLISFVAGRYSSLKVIKKLRDYVYEKDLDS